MPITRRHTWQMSVIHLMTTIGTAGATSMKVHRLGTEFPVINGRLPILFEKSQKYSFSHKGSKNGAFVYIKLESHYYN